MWLLLCGINDLSALWAVRGLKARGLTPFEIITVEALVYCRRFVHRITTVQSSVTIELTDGHVICSKDIRGTLNQIQLLPFEHLSNANSIDRKYAEQELYALFLSWLYSLPGPLLNKPTPQGLSGTWRHLSEWVWLASQAGLPIIPYYQSEASAIPLPDTLPHVNTRSIIVLNDKCFGTTAPLSVQEGCVRLAQLSATSILGVDFQVTKSGTWIFINATPHPDLRLGGEALLDKLSKVLQP
jgi:hypothetical protein